MKNIVLILALLSFLFSCGNQTKNKQEKVIVQSDLVVSGMTCTGCENAIQNKVNEIEGVEFVSASHKEGTTQIKYDKSQTDVEALITAIEAKGYTVVDHKESIIE